MQSENIFVEDTDRSVLLRVFVKFRSNQTLLLNKYKKKSLGNIELSNNKGNNSSILLWEIIHFIAEADFDGRNVSVSDIYLSLGISKSTAIRCISLLENLEILEKSRDRNDRRRAVITLNEEFRSEFMRYLDHIISELVEITGIQPKSHS